jgi:hypothetical protein
VTTPTLDAPRPAPTFALPFRVLRFETGQPELEYEEEVLPPVPGATPRKLPFRMRPHDQGYGAILRTLACYRELEASVEGLAKERDEWRRRALEAEGEAERLTKAVDALKRQKK